MNAEHVPAPEVELRPAITGRELVPFQEPDKAESLSRLCWVALFGLLIVSALMSLTLLILIIKGIAWLLGR